MTKPLTVSDLRPWVAERCSGWTQREWSVKRVQTTDQGATVEWQLRQVHATGVPVSVDGVSVFDVRDGRITSVRDYYNAVAYLQFLRQ